MTELNPDHAVTQGLRGQWHKLLAFVLFRYRGKLPDDVVITEADLHEFRQAFGDGGAVVAHDKASGLHLRLVSQEEARHLADEEGRRGR